MTSYSFWVNYAFNCQMRSGLLRHCWATETDSAGDRTEEKNSFICQALQMLQVVIVACQSTSVFLIHDTLCFEYGTVPWY